MTLVAFATSSPYSPDVIVADLDLERLQKWELVAGMLQKYATAVEFETDGGTIYNYPWPKDKDLGPMWLLPEDIEFKFLKVPITYFLDGEFTAAVFFEDGRYIESNMFSVYEFKCMLLPTEVP